jgi:hypothetical protein
MATSFDSHRNLAISSVVTAPSPATSGTSLTVTSGQGSRFTANMNATIAPSGSVPDPSNSEVVRITAVSGDVLTITRTQEGSSARTVVVGDVIFAGPTSKTLTDVETAVNNIESLVINGKTGNYTIVATDSGQAINVNSASAATITLPQFSDAGIAIGSQIIVFQMGAGTITFSAGTGATVNYYSPTSAASAQTAGQYAAVTLIKAALNLWLVFGAK